VIVTRVIYEPTYQFYGAQVSFFIFCSPYLLPTCVVLPTAPPCIGRRLMRHPSCRVSYHPPFFMCGRHPPNQCQSRRLSANLRPWGVEPPRAELEVSRVDRGEAKPEGATTVAKFECGRSPSLFGWLTTGADLF
jgi:hypothetical protein